MSWEELTDCLVIGKITRRDHSGIIFNKILPLLRFFIYHYFLKSFNLFLRFSSFITKLRRSFSQFRNLQTHFIIIKEEAARI